VSKLVFVDIETTGTDSKKHGIVQISGMVEVDGSIKQDFDLKVAPFPEDEIDPAALEVIGRSEDDLWAGVNPQAAHSSIVATLGRYVDKFNRMDKFDIVGFGVTFDDQFLRDWFRMCGDIYYGSFFRWPPIDVAVLAANKLIGKRGASDFKLATVAEMFGIEVDRFRTHDAMYDIEITRELYQKVRS
jgi:DNA polymerase-3 subunit epsilon